MIQQLTDIFYRNREMVKYWKTAESVEAKVYRSVGGHMEMQMLGEKYPFPGYPRGSLLYGKLSPLKHWIKNKVFNDTWRLLDEGREEEVRDHIKNDAQPYIFGLAEQCKYDMVPNEGMVPPVKEIHRALSVASNDPTTRKWRDIITFILQEDDAYRMRFQWMTKFYPRHKKPTCEDFLHGFKMLEHGEVVDDMKERARLLRRGFGAIVKDPETRGVVDGFLRVLDLTKLQLTRADKYFFRAKYFKVDWPAYQY